MLDSVDLSKKVVSSRWKISDTKYKYFCGYLNNDGGKNMSFVTDDKEIYEKYNEIWNVVKKLLKLKFFVSSIRDDKYIITKLKIFKNINPTTFTDNVMPIEKRRYICIPAIDIDSVLKIDKKVFPQAYLEQCKYKLKKRRHKNFIDIEIIDDDEDDSFDSDNKNENNVITS